MSLDPRPPVQLSLGVSLKEDTTFGNFYAGKNALLLQALQAFSDGVGEQLLLAYGSDGSGVSHLLQACCHRALGHGASALYLPLAELKTYPANEVIEGLETLDLICIDDIDQVQGDEHWEQALFHLYNRAKDLGRRLLFGAHCAPGALNTQLPDLKSRLLGCVIFQIQTLDDQEKSQALKARANGRGLELSDEVVAFLLNRAARATPELFKILDLLDQASLQQQRKVTVPFVKTVLGL